VPKREHPVGCGVSLHMIWPGVMHIPHRQHHVVRHGVKRHSRSGARLGAGQLCKQVCTHRTLLQGKPSASTEASLRQIVKELPLWTAVRSNDRGHCADAQAGGAEQKTKRPGSLSDPGLCEQSVEGARLRASLSRVHLVLGPIKLLTARGLAQMQCSHATAERLHRFGAHERDLALDGSGAGGDAG